MSLNEAISTDNPNPSPQKPAFSPPPPPKSTSAPPPPPVPPPARPLILKPVDAMPNPQMHVLDDPDLQVGSGKAKKRHSLLRRAQTIGATVEPNPDLDQDDNGNRISELDAWLNQDKDIVAIVEEEPTARKPSFLRRISSSLSASAPKRPSLQNIKAGLRSRIDTMKKRGSGTNSVFTSLHKKAWMSKKSHSMPVGRRRSKLSKTYSKLEEMLLLRLDRMSLQRALCAKSLSPSQKEHVRAFMLSVSSSTSPSAGDVVPSDDASLCTVLHPFVKEDNWQVTVETSDVVYINSRLKTGWWFVYKLSPTADGAYKIMGGEDNKGILPGICCDWKPRDVKRPGDGAPPGDLIL